jgi:hypothetical protein
MADWLLRRNDKVWQRSSYTKKITTNQVPAGQPNLGQAHKEPEQKDFLIPATDAGYKEVVTRLMLGGTSKSEANL